MKVNIVYSQKAPNKTELWLHKKNDDMVLEVFGSKGWESVINDADIKSLKEAIEKIQKEETKNTIKANVPTLSEDCSKIELINNVNTIKNVLVKAGILKA